MKEIFKIMKKIVIGALLLYSYNLIAVSFNMMIPINWITILLVAFLDIPGILLLALSLAIIF